MGVYHTMYDKQLINVYCQKIGASSILQSEVGFIPTIYVYNDNKVNYTGGMAQNTLKLGQGQHKPATYW